MSERTGFLTEAEVIAANLTLPADAPYGITGCANGHFSIARHYGAITFQGYRYTYIPEHDELIRDDVLKMAQGMRKAAKRLKAMVAVEEAAGRQGELL